MRTSIKTIIYAASMMFMLVITARFVNAQIPANETLRVTLSHSFIVGDKELPPGVYDFKLLGNLEQNVMTVWPEKGGAMIQFQVRQSQADHMPAHTELVFNRYGKDEVLSKIYEKGNKLGIAVAEPPKQEVEFQKAGQHAVEHTEEQD